MHKSNLNPSVVWKNHLFHFLLTALLPLSATSASAATRHWDGGGANGFWDTAANWSNNVPPVNGDALFFPTNAARLANTNRASANLTNFHSIRFTGDGYSVSSVPFINLTNGVTNAGFINSANTLNASLTLRGNQTWAVGGRNTLTANSNVAWSGSSLTNDLDGTLIMNGVFNGGVGAQLIKLGGGRLELNGTPNSIPTVRVIDGTLQVDGALTAASLAISNGASLIGTGSVPAFTCAGDFSPAGTSTPGLLTMTGAGNATFAAGARFFASINGLTPGADYDQFKTPSPPNLSGATLLVLRSASFPFAVGQKFVIVTNMGASVITTTFTNLAQNARLTNSGVVFHISYTGGSGNDVELTVVDAPFVGTGVTRTWDGGGANTFFSTAANWVGDIAPQEGDSILFPTGLLTPDNVASNNLNIRFNQLLCASSGGGITLRGQPLFIGGGIIATQASGALTVFNSVSFLNGGPIQTASGNIVLHGSVTNGGSDLNLTGGSGRVEFGGVMSGDGGLVVSNNGGALLNNGNIYQGTTRLLRGPVTVSAPGSLGDSGSGPTFVGEDVTLIVASTRLFESSISLTGRMTFTDTTTNVDSAIQIRGPDVNMLGFPGDIIRFTGPLTGDGRLSLDQGEFVFGNSHDIAGGISVANRGFLRVNGTGTSDITIGNFDGRLGGTGSVGRVSVLIAGTGRIEPGQSPGVLTTSNLVLNGTVTNVFELNGPAPGSGHDQLRVLGSVNLGGSRLQLSLGYTPAVGDTFVIIDNDGADAVTGTFAGLAEGALVNAGSNVVRLTYVGGTGNDVALTVLNAPFAPSGVTRAWDGGGGSNNRNWSTAVNWDANTLPNRGDDLVFPASAPSNTRIMANNLAATNAVFNRLWFGGQGITWIVRSNALKIFAGIVATNELPLGNTSFDTANVELIGPQTWSSTNMDITLNAPLLLGGHTLTLASEASSGVNIQEECLGPGALIAASGRVSFFSQVGASNVAVTIQGGSVFAGFGSFTGPPWQMSGGELRPATAQLPGLQMTGGTLDLSSSSTATIAGNLTLAPAAGVSAQFGSATNTPLVVTGAVNLAGARLAAGFADLSLLGTALKLIDKTGAGAITGTFAGLPEAALFTATNENNGLVTLYRISYAGGDGNDVTLTPVPPSPSGFTRTWTGAGAGALWPTAANWTGNTPPGNGDTAIFPVNAAQRANTNSNGGLVLNTLAWEGSNYLHSGNISLISGLRHGAAGGTNAFADALLVSYGEQTWAVSNAAATLRVFQENTDESASITAAAKGDGGIIDGLGPITKTGAGTLELDNVTFGARGGLIVNGGVARLARMNFVKQAPLILQQGRIEALSATTESVLATNGELALIFAPLENEPGVFGGLFASTGITLGSNLTLTLHWTNEASAGIGASQIDLGDARLNVTFPPALPADEVLRVAQYFTGGLTGEFANLPEGAVTNFAGRDWEIHYAVEIPGEQSDTRFITLSSPVITPRFTSIERLGNGDVILRGTASAGATVNIEASKIVESFVFIGSTVANGAGQFTFLDAAPAFVNKFYRAVVP